MKKLKKGFFDFLKLAVPVGLGIYLVIYIYNDLSPEEKDALFTALRSADYSWAAISILFGILSHMSRAWRWKYLLEPLGHFPKFWNSFFAVMVGYIVNMAIPRAGEASRGAVLSRYENIPFEKSFGTILAERAIDMIMLLAITSVTIFLQFSRMEETYLSLRNVVVEKLTFFNLLIMILGLGIAAIFFWFLWKKTRNNKITIRIRSAIEGLIEGLKTIFTMKKKGWFFLHTFLIWALYVGMFWICFYTLSETTSVPPGGIMAAFITGGFSVILVPGGIGAFPAAVMQILVLYGVSREGGFALGWIAWAVQTIMIIVLGGLSLLLLPVYNRNTHAST